MWKKMKKLLINNTKAMTKFSNLFLERGFSWGAAGINLASAADEPVTGLVKLVEIN